MSSSQNGKCCDVTPTNITCPDCGQGTLEPARGRFGPVYQCTNKKVCKVVLTSRPTGTVCNYLRNGKACGRLMVKGTKTIPDRCSDKDCPNRHPHKLIQN